MLELPLVVHRYLPDQSWLSLPPLGWRHWVVKAWRHIYGTHAVADRVGTGLGLDLLRAVIVHTIDVPSTASSERLVGVVESGSMETMGIGRALASAASGEMASSATMGCSDSGSAPSLALASSRRKGSLKMR